MATDTKTPRYPPGPPTSQPGRKPDSETDEDRFYNGVTFASSDYVPWIFGRLRLGNCDTSRLAESGCPVMRNHDPDSLVGAVLTVGKRGDLWASDWRLPKISSNQRTFELMDSGILRGISVGGRLLIDTLVCDNETEAQTVDDMLFTADWMLVEQSLTGIPADTRATVDRMLADVLKRDTPAVFDTLISPQGIFTTATADLQRRVEALRQSHNESIARKRQEAAMTTAPTITDDALERALAAHLEKAESLKRLTEMPDQLAKLTSDLDAERKANMEYRAKLDRLQFQPGGMVLAMENWTPRDNALDIGRILRLTADKELGFPQIDRNASTLEESFLERISDSLAAPDRSTMARVPFEALMERTRQREVQRNTMAGGAGARPLETHIVGNAGLLFNDYAPILAAMDMRMGLRGSQKFPYFTAQGSAAGAAEGADIPITTYTMDNTEYLPVSVASAFDLSSSLQAVDDMTFESLVDFAILTVCRDELCKQALDGGGSAEDEIAGLWSRISTAGPDNVVEYGAAAANFERDDVLDCKDAVDLSKSDGGPGAWILSTGLYKLAERTPRGVDGQANNGYTEIQRFLMDAGMMEGRMVYHFQDFAPTGVTNAGIYGKLDRCIVLIWGDSFALTEIPVRARKSEYKMTVECNLAVIQPDYNLAGIRQNA